MLFFSFSAWKIANTRISPNYKLVTCMLSMTPIAVYCLLQNKYRIKVEVSISLYDILSQTHRSYLLRAMDRGLERQGVTCWQTIWLTAPSITVCVTQCISIWSIWKNISKSASHLNKTVSSHYIATERLKRICRYADDTVVLLKNQTCHFPLQQGSDSWLNLLCVSVSVSMCVSVGETSVILSQS